METSSVGEKKRTAREKKTNIKKANMLPSPLDPFTFPINGSLSVLSGHYQLCSIPWWDRNLKKLIGSVSISGSLMLLLKKKCLKIRHSYSNSYCIYCLKQYVAKWSFPMSVEQILQIIDKFNTEVFTHTFNVAQRHDKCISSNCL